MAYPFPGTRFDDFIERLKSEYGCNVEPLDVPGLGQQLRISRTVDGRKRKALIMPRDVASPLSPSVVRSVCNRLKVPPEAFGCPF